MVVGEPLDWEVKGSDPTTVNFYSISTNNLFVYLFDLILRGPTTKFKGKMMVSTFYGEYESERKETMLALGFEIDTLSTRLWACFQPSFGVLKAGSRA